MGIGFDLLSYGLNYAFKHYEIKKFILKYEVKIQNLYHALMNLVSKSIMNIKI